MSADVVVLASQTPKRSAFAITADELDALFGAGPLAFLLYVQLRACMDWRTRVVGVTRALSLEMLATLAETEVPRGKGVQMSRPTVKQVRTALEVLKRRNLLRRRETEVLVFLMPMARTENVRPFQTGHSEGTSEGTVKAIYGAGLRAIEETQFEPNRAHIKSQALLSTQPAASHHSTGVDAAPIFDAADASDVPSEESVMRDARAVKIDAVVVLLTEYKVKYSGLEVKIESWIDRGIRVEHVKTAIGKALDRRKKDESPAPIHINFLDALLASIKPPRSSKAKSKAPPEKPDWRRNSASINAMARSLDMSLQLKLDKSGFEDYAELVKRIEVRLREVGHER